jgi:hypothetical protein
MEPKGSLRVHKSPPPVPILKQTNVIQIPESYFSYILITDFPYLCVQTGSGAHPASCTVGTGGLFPRG